LEEGRRMARSGGREDAEPVLAKATLALWSVLNPPFSVELRRLKDALLARRATGGPVDAAVEQFRELTGHLGRRNFGATIECYRRLRDLVDAPGAGPTAIPATPDVASPASAGSSK
jgi:hypothetical protein